MRMLNSCSVLVIIVGTGLCILAADSTKQSPFSGTIPLVPATPPTKGEELLDGMDAVLSASKEIISLDSTSDLSDPRLCEALATSSISAEIARLDSLGYELGWAFLLEEVCVLEESGDTVSLENLAVSLGDIESPEGAFALIVSFRCHDKGICLEYSSIIHKVDPHDESFMKVIKEINDDGDTIYAWSKNHLLNAAFDGAKEE